MTKNKIRNNLFVRNDHKKGPLKNTEVIRDHEFEQMNLLVEFLKV